MLQATHDGRWTLDKDRALKLIYVHEVLTCVEHKRLQMQVTVRVCCYTQNTSWGAASA